MFRITAWYLLLAGIGVEIIYYYWKSPKITDKIMQNNVHVHWYKISNAITVETPVVGGAKVSCEVDVVVQR